MDFVLEDNTVKLSSLAVGELFQICETGLLGMVVISDDLPTTLPTGPQFCHIVHLSGRIPGMVCALTDSLQVLRVVQTEPVRIAFKVK